MKRKLALLLACVLMVSTFAACGDQKTSSKGDVPTLTWYIPGATPADCDLVEAEINKIIEPEIGAKLDFIYLDSGAYDEKMNMMMASQTPFDLAFSGWVNKFDKGVSRKGFLKLDKYLDKHPKLKEAVPELAWKAVTADDGIYAVPNQQIYIMWQALYITKKYVDKYNLDVSKVKGPKDLIPFMEKIRDNEPDVYVYKTSLWPFVSVNTTLPVPSLANFMVDNNDPECKVYAAYETEKYLDAAKTIKDFYDRGFIRKDIASSKGSTTSSKQTVITQGAYKPGAEADIARTDRGEVVAIPLGEPFVSADMIRQTLTAVGALSKNPDKAVKLLEMVNTDKELFRLIVHGIEGKHYEKLESGHIRILDSKSYGQHTAGWYYGNQFNSYVVEGKDLDIWDQMRELNETAQKSPLIGFNFDSSKIVNEISNVSAATDEFNGLENGTVDTEQTLAKYKKAANVAGAQAIITELQKQIDAFLQKK